MKLLATPPDLNKIARPNWIEINLDALCNNIQFIRSQIPANTKILLPVKADSYGHGSLACSFAAKFGGADYLGVAHISEGMLLRQYGMDLPILVLGPCTPADFAYFVEFQLTAAITDIRTAMAFDQFLRDTGTTCKAHLAIDTGMNRYGFDAEDFNNIRAALSLKNLHFEVDAETVIKRMQDIINAMDAFGTLPSSISESERETRSSQALAINNNAIALNKKVLGLFHPHESSDAHKELIQASECVRLAAYALYSYTLQENPEQQLILYRQSRDQIGQMKIYLKRFWNATEALQSNNQQQTEQ